MAGKYQIEKENAAGYLFQGDLPSVYWRREQDILLVNGGIWLPRDKATAPRIYFYRGPWQIKGKTVEDVERARVAVLAKRLSAIGDDRQSVTSAAIQNTPASLSPIHAGVAAGLAEGIVAVIEANHSSQPLLHGEPRSAAFIASVRQTFVPEVTTP